MEEKKEKKKLNLKERWKDKRERAKIELMLYGIFFLVIIIFARISSSMSTNIPKNNDINNTFIDEITDNYQYDIDIMKVIYMLAIHELGETIIGDLTQFQISKEEKDYLIPGIFMEKMESEKNKDCEE